MEKVLLTGGAGFIGSNIARTLLARNYQVTIIDNLSTGRFENIKDIVKDVEYLEMDIRDLEKLSKVVPGHNYILHEAAVPSVPRSINNPLLSHESNVNGTFNVLMAARDTSVKKVVCASSSSIYGNRVAPNSNAMVEKREIMKPMPLSPYAVTKLIGEYYCKVFSHIFNVPTVCLRYFNVFGPRQNPNSEYAAVIPKFITALMKNEQPVIYGDGKQTRDFSYVENVIEANILAMTSPKCKEGETINIACNGSHSLLELVDSLNSILGKHIEPIFNHDRAGDVKHSKADISKAKQLIGYEPQVSFMDGLKKTVEWYQTVK